MNHRKTYQDMEDHAPDPRAAERFRRKPYTGAKVLIRRQIGDAAECLAEKYGIRGGNDDKSSEIFNTDILDT